MQNAEFWLIVAVFAGCQSAGVERESAVVEVIGGNPDVGNFPMVGEIIVDPPVAKDGADPLVLSCTAILIEARTVITAASCIATNARADLALDGQTHLSIDDVSIRFGGANDNIGVESVQLHRYFDPTSVSSSNDIALVRLATAPVGIVPAVLGIAALDSSNIGDSIRLVGMGVSDEVVPTSWGDRYVVDTPIAAVENRFLLAGTAGETTCAGDSGAGGFVQDGGNWRLVAVTTDNGRTGPASPGREPTSGCDQNVERLRVDAYAEEFLLPYLRQFDAICPVDGNCDTGCSDPYGVFVDADCDPCAWWNGVCAGDCPVRDWDCDPGVFVGGACESTGDCEENGRCIPAVDDSEFTYCSRPCDVAEMATCPAQMRCDADARECVFEVPSPGSQGFGCVAQTECRSGICEGEICVTLCTPSEPDACPEPYRCGPSEQRSGESVCLGLNQSGGGGFCATGLGSNALGLGLVLAILGMGRRRRIQVSRR